MHTAVRSCVISASWKLKALLRARRFYPLHDLFNLFKIHILSYVEYRTPALLHAASSVLYPLDRILDHFLEELNVSHKDALLTFNLAPLQARRDIAALGVIHRAVLRQGPAHFWSMFVLDQDPPRTSLRLGSQRSRERQVLDVYSQLHRDYLNRSIFGYIWVYNLLPKWITHTSNVKAF